MKFLKSLIALLVAVIMISCNKGNSNFDKTNAISQDIALENIKEEDQNKMQLSADISATTSPITSPPPPPHQVILNNGTQAPAPDWDKKIIKTADVRLELKDYKLYNSLIHANLKNYGAYIAGEEQTQNESEIQNTLTVKVPVDKFEDLMNSFSGEGIKVVQKKITTADVTGEVIDTKGRIAAKRQARDRYLELLKSAKNMKEILEVQSEISSIEEELESARGRNNYLVHEAAYSTINLTYYQFTGATTYDGQSGFATKLVEAFKTGASIISGSVLFLVTIWPLLIAIIGLWFLYKKSNGLQFKALKKG